VADWHHCSNNRICCGRGAVLHEKEENITAFLVLLDL
jgi:hypothetical protein